MEYAVDMQGFTMPGKNYALKELAILPLNYDEEPLVRLFKPLFSWPRLTEKYKRQNLWLELYHHGLEWNSGDLDYSELNFVIRDTLKDAVKIFVSGDLKKNWLERYDLKVLDLNEWGYPSFERSKIVTVCANHNGSHRTTCALHNVKRMKQFYIEGSCMDWEETDEVVEEFL